MTAKFLILINGEIETNYLFQVSSFEDAYKQVQEYTKELDVPATLIQISLSLNVNHQVDN